MKAAAFDYVRAGTVADAIELLSRHGEDARLVAGGQSLVPALNLRLLAPSILIDIGGIAALRDIAWADGRLRLGATVRHVDLMRSAEVARHAPIVAEAVAHVAHPAIRNRGTLGGNLAQADPASELPACMVALEAEIVLDGPAGPRRVAAAAFFRGVFETALDAGEMIVAVEIPARPARERHAFLELARRSGDYALAGIACTGGVAADGVLCALRPVFFAVGPKPILAADATAVLVGARPDEAALAAARAALAGDLAPDGDLQVSGATRMHLAGVLLGRALARILSGPGDAVAP